MVDEYPDVLKSTLDVICWIWLIINGFQMNTIFATDVDDYDERIQNIFKIILLNSLFNTTFFIINYVWNYVILYSKPVGLYKLHHRNLLWHIDLLCQPIVLLSQSFWLSVINVSISKNNFFWSQIDLIYYKNTDLLILTHK